MKGFKPSVKKNDWETLACASAKKSRFYHYFRINAEEISSTLYRLVSLQWFQVNKVFGRKNLLQLF